MHFQQKKNLQINCDNFQEFLITPKGFCNKNELSNKSFYLKNLQLVKYINFRIKRKIKKISTLKEEKWKQQ